MSEAPKEIWCSKGLYYENKEDRSGGGRSCIKYVRADRIEELEAKLKWVLGERDATFALMLKRAESAEAKLAKAVKALQTLKDRRDYQLPKSQDIARTTLAELKGEIDE